jgi:hypothetical protein
LTLILLVGAFAILNLFLAFESELLLHAKKYLNWLIGNMMPNFHDLFMTCLSIVCAVGMAVEREFFSSQWRCWNRQTSVFPLKYLRRIRACKSCPIDR